MGRRARIARADPDSPGLGLICPGCSGVNHAALASPFQACVRRHGGVARQPGSASVGRRPNGLGGWGRGPSHAAPHLRTPCSRKPSGLVRIAAIPAGEASAEGLADPGAARLAAKRATRNRNRIEIVSRSGPLQGRAAAGIDRPTGGDTAGPRSSST